MDERIKSCFRNIKSDDGTLQNQAFCELMEVTKHPVDWSYEVWDEMVQTLSHNDNRRRAIAAQVLCNLAKSDSESRMLKDFKKLLAVTKDERFVTARHCLQNLWKIGAVGKKQKKMLVDGLARRFQECASEKNCTLIRYDILVGLKKLHDEVKDETIRKKALELMETEEDVKYRKKYGTVWKTK